MDIRYLPWQHEALRPWSIVGMNHYHKDGKRWLFVALVREGVCIQQEGPDNESVWNQLVIQAQRLTKDSH